MNNRSAENRPKSKIELLKEQLNLQHLHSTNNHTQVAPREIKPLNNNQLIENITISALGKSSQEKHSSQQLTVQQELQELKQKQNSVRDKAKQLEILFQKQTSSLTKHIKENKTSEIAKTTLIDLKSLAQFENQQNIFIEEIQEKLQSDMKTFTTLPKTLNISQAEFIKLAFIYRSYEVCLEQDNRKHMANKFQSLSLPIIANLTGKPAELAIISLNYYEDFFKNLNEIEKIWAEAGKSIRRLELKDTFIIKIYNNLDIGLKVLENVPESIKQFEADYQQFLTTMPEYLHFIEQGDGLDMVNHPWTKVGCRRIDQPNKPIDFTTILSSPNSNETLPHHQEVEQRVDTDRKKFNM